MQVKTVLHKGLQEQCPVCRPDFMMKRERRTRMKRTGVSTDVAVRRQVDAELGEDSPSQTVGAIRQKYGTASVRVDKKVTLPKWKLEWLSDRLSINSTLTPEGAWQKRQAEWQKSIPKFLIPRYQQKQSQPEAGRQPNRPWREIKFKNPQAQTRHQDRHRDTRTSRPNSGPIQTATRPS